MSTTAKLTAAERAERYLDRAIDAAVAAVENAGPSERNNTLFRSVAGVVALCNTTARHWISTPTRDALYMRFRAAADRAGLLGRREGGETQFRLTFESAWNAGQKEPRELPESLAAALADATKSSGTDAPVLPAAIPPLPPEPPSYPPTAEVTTLWAACTRADEDPAVATWLRDQRGIDPVRVADEDLARALPRAATTPTWAQSFGVRWAQSDHRLLVPLYDQYGCMRSMLARTVGAAEPNKKSGAVAGFNRVGLALACPLARQVLARASLPEWWPSAVDLRVIVVEGEMDYLVAATEWSDSAACAPAVIGIFGGSWSAELAAMIPDGTVVVLATHHDAAGDKYASKVLRSLAGRDLRVERTRAAA